MRFAVDIQRVPMIPFRFRRRIGFRNSKIRLEIGRFANYERWRIFGLDICIEWGGKLYAGKRRTTVVAHGSGTKKV